MRFTRFNGFTRFVVPSALVLASSGVLADPPNLVVNGSFEANVLADGTYHVYGPTQVPGWTVPNQLELRRHESGSAEDGLVFAELDAFSNNSISQLLDTVVGTAYELSFWYSNRSNVAVTSNGLAFDLGSGAVVLPALPFNGSGDNAWTHFSTDFVATSTQTLLTFTALGTSDSYGSSLDDVRVSTVAAVPEPGTWGLMVAGLASLGFVGRRRRAGGRAPRR